MTEICKERIYNCLIAFELRFSASTYHLCTQNRVVNFQLVVRDRGISLGTSSRISATQVSLFTVIVGANFKK